MAKSKIIKELANNSISLDVALSRLFIIASDIGNDELQQWTEYELHGYGEHKLPEYRYAKNTVFKYSGINGNYQVSNAPLPLLEIMKTEDPTMFYLPIPDGISTIEGFANNPTHSEVGRDITWAATMVYEMSGIQCYSIKQLIPLNTFEDVLNNVKMLLMKIFLKLDKEYGCLDDLDVDTTAKTPDEVDAINKVVNNYIFIDNSVNVGDRNKLKGSGIFGGGKGRG